jgi:hypothetical protein
VVAIALVVFSLVVLFAIAFLLLPASWLILVVASTFSIIVTAILLLRRDYRARFREYLEECGGKVRNKNPVLFKYATAVYAVMLLLLLVYSQVMSHNLYLLDNPYVLYTSAVIVVAFFVSAAFFLVGVLRFLGKLGVLLIASALLVLIGRLLILFLFGK